MQINNLRLRHYKTNQHWSAEWIVFAPDGRALEEFSRKECAVAWMQRTRDFCRRKK